jgi:hypothetical protein
MENGDIQQDMLSPPPACDDHQTKCEANLICLPATHPDDLQMFYQNAVQAQQEKSWPAIQEYLSLLCEGWLKTEDLKSVDSLP